MNDPEEYEEMAYEELAGLARRETRQGRQLRIRWNDSGDFFTGEYYNIADRVTKRLKKRGYNVRSYAYTKMSKYVDKSREDFIINFSAEARTSEVKNVNIETVKLSKVIPKDVTKSFMIKVLGDDGKKKPALDKTPEAKQAIATHYGVDVSKLKYLEELPEVEGATQHEFDVIVSPIDSDEAAQRNDVRVSYLVIH